MVHFKNLTAAFFQYGRAVALSVVENTYTKPICLNFIFPTCQNCFYQFYGIGTDGHSNGYKVRRVPLLADYLIIRDMY
jgi:hypothetical protein